jgi:carbamoyl-phosphate synthase large subunit
VPNTAADVDLVSELRDVLPCRTFLPSKSVVERCQNAYELGLFLRAHKVPAATGDDLPGRDLACQSLWKNGRLVLIKTVERLAYLGTEVSGGAPPVESLAKTVNEPLAVGVCVAAIRALDPQANGVFSVDLEEDEHGVPCVVRIGAGRFTAMLNFFDLTGRHNMSATYVRLALDEPVGISDPYDLAEDRYFVRGIDSLPAIYRAEQLSEGIEEVA